LRICFSTRRSPNKSAAARVVAGLFFPRSKTLGLNVDHHESPAAMKKARKALGSARGGRWNLRVLVH
jgi:hypothetical protein